VVISVHYHVPKGKAATVARSVYNMFALLAK
jgi:hypothetical protein